MRGVRVSNTVSTVLSPQIIERPRAHFASDVGGICIPSSRIPNTSLRMTLPEIPTIVVSRGLPPSFLQQFMMQHGWLPTVGIELAGKLPNIPDMPQAYLSTHLSLTAMCFAGPASGAPLYTGLGFDFDTHVPVSGLTTPTPSLSIL